MTLLILILILAAVGIVCYNVGKKRCPTVSEVPPAPVVPTTPPMVPPGHPLPPAIPPQSM